MRVNIGKTKRIKDAAPIERLEVTTFDSMAGALDCADEFLRFFGRWMTPGERDRVMGGQPDRQSAYEARSEDLVEQAIAEDPRLASRAVWQRCELGEICDAGLLAAEEEQPCFERVRRFQDWANDSEPVRVVISTDASEIGPDTPAALMACVRIVQQFRPAEVWWQGAWLDEGRDTGRVFLVPLVRGDMDFSRLDFCIADPERDGLSFSIRGGLNLRSKELAKGQFQAERSYLAGAYFVDHAGVRPDARSIAHTAARWLGLPSLFWEELEERDDQQAGLQSLPDPVKKHVPPRQLTEEERATQERLRREREEADRRRANSRVEQTARSNI